MKPAPTPLKKPLLRGYFHQEAFFFALGACGMLISKSQTSRQLIASTVYSLSLTGLLGISTLYHRIQWEPIRRMWMRRLDHSAIFLLIAGTVTPICLLSMHEKAGTRLLTIIWIAAVLGVLQSIFWVHAPKWLAATLYIGMGWLAVPYLPELRDALGSANLTLIVAGGLFYSLGAVIYATKKPNPVPLIFGYHEIFHLLVILAAALHFLVINQLIGA